jgi:hypothetical protein
MDVKVHILMHVDPQLTDLTFQDTADPAVDEAVDVLVAAIIGLDRMEPDLARVEGRALEPGEADAKQAVHEFTELLHGVTRDEQALGDLPDVAPCPREDARPHGLLSRQERQDLRQDLVRKLAEAVRGINRRSWRCRRGESFLVASRTSQVPSSLDLDDQGRRRRWLPRRVTMQEGK